MLMECREARRLMHAQLDNDITALEEQALNRHVSVCAACATARQTLRSTVDGLASLANGKVPTGFTAGVMAQIGPAKKGVGQHWVKMLATAAMLLFLIGSPAYLIWTMANPQVILNDLQASITLQGAQARIATGQVVSGDITIYKAQLVIAGEVRGNVKVIAGSVKLEDGGQVLGRIIEVPDSVAGKLKLAVAELWDDIRHLFLGR